jgi:murein L,D-transpeptidase YcbB/YkuD
MKAPSCYKKSLLLAVSLPFFIFFLTLPGCKNKPAEIAKVLYKKTPNKVFRDIYDDDFAVVFKKVLAEEKVNMTYPQWITDYYDSIGYKPVLFLADIQNGSFNNLTDYYDKSTEHGFDPKMFQSEQIKELAAKFKSTTEIKTPDEAYHDMARLEILVANSLINYSNDLQYGIINPKRIYSRYFMATKRPDSLSINQVLKVKNLAHYLDSIQPKDPQYIALQKAYVSNEAIGDLSPEESKRVLLVNLERLRWRNKPTENKYVIVNIPDYRLDVMDSGKSVLNMKVCVGMGRNMDNAKTLLHYDDTDKVDNPNPHQTPILNSLIHSVQVNPVWNIPQSIATKEIIVEAQKDPYYLSNKNINVYKDDKLVEDSEDIDWNTVDKSDYSFKQQPGSDNSLGKIKFLFNNKSNVYLHDTPAKSYFYRSMRAVSHGCVRLGDPQGLALNLFGQGSWQYAMIDSDMAKQKPDPTTIGLPKKVPVYITYVTCWADENGVLQYRKDVYGMDIVLYAHLMDKLGSN